MVEFVKTKMSDGKKTWYEYPLFSFYEFCPTARFVGGVSRFLCECKVPETCEGVGRVVENHSKVFMNGKRRVLPTPSDLNKTIEKVKTDLDKVETLYQLWYSRWEEEEDPAEKEAIRRILQDWRARIGDCDILMFGRIVTKEETGDGN